ncbi:MAG: hypothetical protein WCO52_05995 [bacterium]
MATLTYAQLTQAIEDYCQNTEPTFVSNIPTFVQLAEERVYNSVQLPAIRKNQTGTLTATNKYLTLPTDWLATFSLAVIDPVSGAYSYPLDKDVNFIRQSFPTPTVTGTPGFYAQFDQNTLILGPTPDQSYAVELHYYYYPTSIVTAGTSWLGNNFAEVLLYGALREAYLFMKGEQDIIGYYEQKYQEGMGLLKQLGDGKNRRDAYRNGQVRVPVQ